MSPIKTLPNFAWSDYSLEEIRQAGHELPEGTDVAFAIGQVAVCGLIYATYTSPPWFWFALAQGITIRDLVDFRRLATLIPRGALTAIRASYKEGIRFAKLYGFEETSLRGKHNGRVYKIFRRT